MERRRLDSGHFPELYNRTPWGKREVKHEPSAHPLLFAGSLLAVQASPADLRYESKRLGLRLEMVEPR